MTTWLRYFARRLTLTVTCALVARVSPAQDRASVASPDGRNRVTVEIRDGALTYRVDRDGRAVLLPSRLGPSRGAKWPGSATIIASCGSRWRR